MYAYLQANPQQLPPVTQLELANHDSYACQQLLALEPTDLLHDFPTSPTYFVLWDGDTDAEQGTDLNEWLSCTQQYIQNVLNAFPNTVIVFPNTPADVITAGYGPVYLSLVGQYNAALPGFLAQFACGSIPQGCVVPVDVHTLTTLPDGYGNPQFTYIDFNNLGWQTVMINFRAVIQ
jgi:hypothetical protein